MEPTSGDEPNHGPKTSNNASSDDYLTQQIADARIALESTLDDMTLDLARAADLRRWVRRYPWPALGVALVAGFTTAHFLSSEHREKVEMGLDGDEDEISPPVDFTAAATTNPQKKKKAATNEANAGWRSTAISALFDILRMAVTQFISASVRQAAATRSASTSGHRTHHAEDSSDAHQSSWDQTVGTDHNRGSSAPDLSSDAAS